MNVKERIKKLRNLMLKNKIDAYIIPSFDSHQSEYVTEHFKCRQFISGFTGSSGTVLITKDFAGLWTDGRYYIQAEKQIYGSGIELFKSGQPSVPSYIDWLYENLQEGSCVGFDGRIFSVNMVENMESIFKIKNIQIKYNIDLIDEIWEDRPSLPISDVFIHDIKYSGVSRNEKINLIIREMKKVGAKYYLLSSLDDIAWLFNIRGRDIPNNPVVISYAIISEGKSFLFVDDLKISQKVKKELEKDNIEIRSYENIVNFLRTFTQKDSIVFDKNKTSIYLYNQINRESRKIEHTNFTSNFKSIKNDVEIKNLENCQIKDGVAMVKFIKWVKAKSKDQNITEIDAEKKLEEFRKENENYIEPSFDTIAAYKDHAAMMHYKATKDITYTLKNEGLFLVDSGGQYLDGTTDITRTIALGEISEEEKKDFTLVLKAHIGLSTAKFLYGATGSNLDVLARKPLWDHGIDYKCGTGHGVGFLLNVHEGPQSFSQTPNNIKIEKNMVITNEPGIYREGKHGIRTENMILVVKDEKTDFGQFMKFKNLTLCPIDLDAVNVNMLTNQEIKYLNNYHEKVYKYLAPKLNKDERLWLKNATRKISKK